jgi:hypothetical protein
MNRENKASKTGAQKYKPGKDPLEVEAQIPSIKPSDGDHRKAVLEVLKNIENAPGATADDRAAVALYRTNYAMEEVPTSVNDDFLKRFWCWLIGRGTEKDTSRTKWGRANVAAINSEVAAYVELFVKKRLDYALKIVKLNTSVPQTLNEYYLYFKYIVNGKVKQATDDNGTQYFDFSDDDYLRDWSIMHEAFRDKETPMLKDESSNPRTGQIDRDQLRTLQSAAHPMDRTAMALTQCVGQFDESIQKLIGVWQGREGMKIDDPDAGATQQEIDAEVDLEAEFGAMVKELKDELDLDAKPSGFDLPDKKAIAEWKKEAKEKLRKAREFAKDAGNEFLLEQLEGAKEKIDAVAEKAEEKLEKEEAAEAIAKQQDEDDAKRATQEAAEERIRHLAIQEVNIENIGEVDQYKRDVRAALKEAQENAPPVGEDLTALINLETALEARIARLDQQAKTFGKMEEDEEEPVSAVRVAEVEKEVAEEKQQAKTQGTMETVGEDADVRAAEALAGEAEKEAEKAKLLAEKRAAKDAIAAQKLAMKEAERGKKAAEKEVAKIKKIAEKEIAKAKKVAAKEVEKVKKVAEKETEKAKKAKPRAAVKKRDESNKLPAKLSAQKEKREKALESLRKAKLIRERGEKKAVEKIEEEEAKLKRKPVEKRSARDKEDPTAKEGSAKKQRATNEIIREIMIDEEIRKEAEALPANAREAVRAAMVRTVAQRLATAEDPDSVKAEVVELRKGMLALLRKKRREATTRAREEGKKKLKRVQNDNNN